MSAASSTALLSALSTELAAMVATVESLSRMAADHVRQSRGEARVRALVDAQAIDDLGQRLSALSDVTGAMADGEDIAAAVSGIRLTDLQSRLRGAVPVSPVASAAGDLMLFE